MNLFSTEIQMQQFDLDFDGGLVDRFPEFEECIRASVAGCRKQLKMIAGDLDMSPSELSRRLANAPGDISFPLHRLPELIASTSDLSPIYWLVEKFCDDPETKHRRNVAMVADLLPRLAALVAQK